MLKGILESWWITTGTSVSSAPQQQQGQVNSWDASVGALLAEREMSCSSQYLSGCSLAGKIEGVQTPSAREWGDWETHLGEIKGGLKGNLQEEPLSWEAQWTGILAKPGAGKEREHCLSPRHEEEVRASVREGELGAGKGSSGIKTNSNVHAQLCLWEDKGAVVSAVWRVALRVLKSVLQVWVDTSVSAKCL